MRKHKWAIIAGVCVVVLLALAGVIYIPRLFRGPVPAVSEGHIILRPAHWWQAEITEQQLSTLAALSGEDITPAQLLQELWPDVLQQMPPEAATCYGVRNLHWSSETYEEWTRGEFCETKTMPGEEGRIACCIYVGTHVAEEGTFEIAGDQGLTEERTYRVSLYTGIGDQP
jgi:hypothetical protein